MRIWDFLSDNPRLRFFVTTKRLKAVQTRPS